MAHFKSFLVFVGVFFTLQNAFSVTNIESEFELLLPKQFQKTLLEKKWKDLEQNNYPFHWNFADQKVNADNINVNLTGLTLDLKTQMGRPALPPSSTSVVLRSHELQADLTIKSIDVDQIVEKEFGGVIGHFHLQAHCPDIRLHMTPGQGHISIQLSPLLNKEVIQTQVDDIDLAWMPNAWTVEPIKCTGVAGFEDLVKQYILSLTSNSTVFMQAQKASIISSLQDSLKADTVNLAEPRALISGRPDVDASLDQITYFGEHGNGTLLRGRLLVSFKNGGQQSNAVLALSANGSLPTNSDTASIRLPENFVNEVVKRAFAANAWMEKVQGSQIPGFEKLRDSCFIDFFIWPELLQYARSAQFLFDVTSSKDVTVKGSNLNYQVSSTFQAQMYAPKGSSYIPFMEFTVPLQSQVKMAVSNGAVQADFVSNTLDLTAQWSPTYVERYHPNQRFAADTIKKSLTKAMAGTTLSYVLPEIPLADDLELKVLSVQNIPKSTDLLISLQ